MGTGNSPNSIQLDNASTTLIVGKNGGGKSTVLDALTFALFGKPFRNINKNQLINSINQKNCLVEIEFSVANNRYRVLRGIKPNIFEIWKNNGLENQDSATKDYQKHLEQQILKMNYKTFTQVVILGAASFTQFMELPAHVRREIQEDLLDIKIFTSMNVILKQQILETKDKIIKIDGAISLAKEKVEAQNRIITSLVETKKENIKNVQQKIDDNIKEIDRLTTAVESLETDITSLKTELKVKKKLEKEIDELKQEKSSAGHSIKDCDKNIKFFKDNVSCPTCEQDISEEHKNHVILGWKEIQELHEGKIAVFDASLKDLQKKITELTKLSDKLLDKQLESSNKRTSISMLQQANIKLQDEIVKAKSDTTNIDDEKLKLKDLAKNALVMLEEKNVLLEQRALQDVATVLLKDTGIKTTIIKEYLPVMNKLINLYLSRMDFFVRFELDEAFNEKIKSRHRDEFTYASFSQGEKMRIDLALLFTWRQIAKMKNSVNTNLLFFDEILDSSLDLNGTDYFLQVISAVVENTNVFVISHREDIMADKFVNVIKFEKRKDYSVITS